MGWIRGPRPHRIEAPTTRVQAKEGIEYVEDIINVAQGNNPTIRQATSEPDIIYPFRPLTEDDKNLPFISPEVVRSKRRPGALSGKMNDPEESRYYWIVVDDIVYDCSSFIQSHPGGEQVILSFVGEDCSWQFWRFHGKNEMEQYGKELRIGRTKEVENRFSEPVRFVGLSKFGNDDW